MGRRQTNFTLAFSRRLANDNITEASASIEATERAALLAVEAATDVAGIAAGLGFGE